MLAEALEHLVRGIVDHPDDVHVRSREQRRGRSLEVRVHPDDLGKVIGRGGRTATAFRTVLGPWRAPACASTSSTSTAARFRVDRPREDSMLVTVGRIGRPHGIRGEVSVEVRTDAADLRFADGARLTTEPERVGPLTVRQTRWHGAGCWCASTGWPTARGRGGSARCSPAQ